MTGSELRTVISRLGITQAAFGMAIDVDARTVRRWLAGDRNVPPHMCVLVKVLTTLPEARTMIGLPRELVV